MKVTIYCGVPGAGKSTLIKQRHPGARVFSADDFFLSEDGVYRFDPRLLSNAHGSCLRQFVWALEFNEDDISDIVVDNTNTTVAEIAPYAALALAYGYNLKVVTVLCDPAVAAARNVHGVPEAAVRAMADRLAKREMPPWWPHEEVQS